MAQRRKVDTEMAAKMMYVFGGAKLVDIAKQLHVRDSQVRAWKMKGNWDRYLSDADELVQQRIASELAQKRAEAVTQGITFTEDVLRIVQKYAISDASRILEPQSFEQAVAAGADAVRLRRELEGQGPTGNVEIVVNIGGQPFENPVPPSPKKVNVEVEEPEQK